MTLVKFSGKVRKFENICFCLTHTNCTYMHLCYLPATDFPTLYYFAEKFVHSRNIILYEAHILSETRKKEKKRKRKENVMHSMSYGSWWTKRTYVMDNVNAWELNHMMMSHNLRLASKSTWFLMKQNPIVRLLIRRNTTNIIPHESVQFCFTS